jgi:endoribonuclease Dicer
MDKAVMKFATDNEPTKSFELHGDKYATSLKPSREPENQIYENESEDEDEETPDVDWSKGFKIEQEILFKSLVREKAAEVDAKQEQKRRIKATNIDVGLSTQQLLEEDNRTALTDPREYQLELFERAKKENTIAVLDTGSGKTFIAVLLIRHVLDQEIERKSAGLVPRTAFFMVMRRCVTFETELTSVARCHRILWCTSRLLC